MGVNTEDFGKSLVKENKDYVKAQFAKYLRIRSEIMKTNWEIKNAETLSQVRNETARRKI
ncbi:hypothetical protein [Candidatus Lokiarchaeum ossiferum]|uniref:hypothetical protein n=1 Tax=Candidatus Lokiarchaeum ossiferum TaxID=2951803 RepID=UPI00352D21DF